MSEVSGGGGGCTVGISSPRTIILRCARQAQHIVYVMFAMFSKHSLVVIGSTWERVPGNGLLFIESM